MAIFFYFEISGPFISYIGVNFKLSFGFSGYFCSIYLFYLLNITTLGFYTVLFGKRTTNFPSSVWLVYFCSFTQFVGDLLINGFLSNWGESKRFLFNSSRLLFFSFTIFGFGWLLWLLLMLF